MPRFKMILVPLILMTVSGVAFTQTYLDPDAPIDARVEDLLDRMTLQEKVGQMTQADHAAVGDLNDVHTYFLGSILSGGGSDPAAGNDPVHWADLYDAFQTQALETRLQIPLIYGIDAVHGHSNVTGATIFPHNIGLGATRNPDLIQEANRITAIEIAATGIDWTFAPCIAVPLDERWGRTYEGFGETPELAEMFAGPAVRGLQNDSLNSPTSIAACAKHYIGDGGTQFGDDQGNAVMTEAELRAIHLPGYIEAIGNDVKTIMASYNSWNGEKLHGHEYLLTDVLKTELGFEGFVISDWAAIDQLPGDYNSDIVNSINAGIDMVMVPNNYTGFYASLISLVQAGQVPQSRIDDAVSRILRVKFELGLFENPMTDRSYLPLVGSQDHRAVAQQTVRESQVILQKNDGILPLPDNNIKILVAGEHADNIGLQSGGWTIQWAGGSGDITEGTTILEGLEQRAPNVEFVYNPDGNFTDDDADYILAVIGEQPYVEGGGDVSDLTVRDSQIRMVRQLKQRGLPVITLLVSGRPMLVQHVLHNSDVFVASWLPGTEGAGIADILFGDFAPSGLLPITWPRSMSQIPINAGDLAYDPLFPYGFGITSLADSPAGSPPEPNSALLTEDGLHIELAFNKPMALGDNSSANFTVLRNAQDNLTVSNFETSPLGENIILITLQETSSASDVLAISYTSGDLQSEDGGSLATFSNLPVTNIMPYISGPLSIPGRIEAENYTSMSGIQLEGTADVGGGENVGWIDAGDWISYDCMVTTAGRYDITFRIAALENVGRINLLIDEASLFTLDLPVTGGWQSWTSITTTAQVPQGPVTIKILAEQGGFNLNWFQFALVSTDISGSGITDFKLAQNYPNPFNPSTTISYTIQEATPVELTIYNMRGETVVTLMDETQNAGTHRVVWHGIDAAGEKVQTGVYFCKMTTGVATETIKMVYLR